MPLGSAGLLFSLCNLQVPWLRELELAANEPFPQEASQADGTVAEESLKKKPLVPFCSFLPLLVTSGPGEVRPGWAEPPALPSSQGPLPRPPWDLPTHPVHRT